MEKCIVRGDLTIDPVTSFVFIWNEFLPVRVVGNTHVVRYFESVTRK